MTVYTVISYSENGSDYCKSCHMSSWDSRFEVDTFNDVESTIAHVALRNLDDLIGRSENRYQYTSWEITILIDGKSSGYYPPNWSWNDDPDPEHHEVIEKIIKVAAACAETTFQARAEEIAAKKAALDKHLADLAKHTQEQKELNEYNRLKAKFDAS